MNATGKRTPIAVLWGAFIFGAIYVIAGIIAISEQAWSGGIIVAMGCATLFFCGCGVGANQAKRRVCIAADLGLNPDGTKER